MSTQPEALTLVERLRSHYGHHFTTTRDGLVTAEHHDFTRHPLVGDAIAEIERLTAAHHAAIHRANDQFDRRQKAEAERDAAQAQAKTWQALYRRAVNEANGLTNYVEDRPELRRAERKLTAIELEARAALAAEGTRK